MGRERYPAVKSLLITADGGGSNGSRVRLWKLELQKLADELDIPMGIFLSWPLTDMVGLRRRASGRPQQKPVVEP